MRRTSLLLLAVLSSCALAAEKTTTIAVTDFAAHGASPELASAASGIVAHELQRLGLFKVVTSDSIRDLLALERQKQLLGCADDSACLTEIVNALGADYLVSGKVTRVEGQRGAATFTLHVTLLDARKAQRVESDIRNASSEAELMTEVKRAVVKLTGRLMTGRSGGLVVTCAEAGATVRVDDAIRGSTPLGGQLELTAGPHFLVVEKDGFISHQRELRIEAGKTLEEVVTLVPSPDFIARYESRTSKMRLGAWISTTAAVVGAAAAVGLQLHARELYGTEDRAGTFQFHRSFLLEGIERDDQYDHRQAATQLKTLIDGEIIGSYVALGVAGAAGIGAAYFWIAGEDPDRYRKFRKLSFSVTPHRAGAVAFLSFDLW